MQEFEPDWIVAMGGGSQDNNSGRETCNTFAKGSINEISGKPFPLSLS